MTLVRRSPRVLLLILSIVALIPYWARPRVHAEEVPPAPGGFLELSTSTDTRPRPTAPDLAALLPVRGTFEFPAPYGTTGVRLTNADDCGGTSDCVRPLGGSTWAHLSNSAGSNLLYAIVGLDRFKGGTGPTLFRYNKTTGETLNLGALFDPSDDLSLSDAAGWYFSATQPTTLYVNIDRELRRYDVLTHAATIVFDITNAFGDDKEVWDAHSSRDDRVHSFTVRLTSNADPVGCGVYREDTAQFSFFPALGAFESCQVDKSGHWLLIKEDADSGVNGVDNRIIDLTLGTETTLLDANGAAGAVDMAFGGMLAADDHNVLTNAIRPWSFGPLTAAPVVYHDTVGTSPTFTSISFANARSAPLGQQFACGSAVNRTNGPRANEIVCVKLDGSLSTLVVAPVMTDLDAAGGGDDDAAKAPNGQLDPAGEYFLWTSNAMGGRLDAFLVRVPSQTLVTAPSDTTAPTVAITTPAQFATVNSGVSLAAAAADNIGVAGVQFKLDGVNLGTKITTAPFAWVWNTTTTTDGVHVLTAVARDAAGNTTVSVPVSVTVLNTPAAPAISSVSAFGVKQTRAYIRWNTNQLADGVIEYGLTAGYGSSTVLDPSLTISHLQLLTGLAPGTTYHFRIMSKNAQGTPTNTGDFTFTTEAALVINGVATSSLAGSSATVVWTTNLASSSQVEYGATTNYGDATDFFDTLVTAHATTLGGLSAGTTYHYRVYSVTASGAVAVSGDFTFTTPSAPGGPGSAAPGGFVESATSTATRGLLSAGALQALLPERGAFTMPAPYGTSAVRVTNAADCAGQDCVFAPGGANWRNLSNSAGSDLLYIVLGLDRGNGAGGPTLFRYNKSTQETVNMGALFAPGDELSFNTAAGWYFSATQPTTLYVHVDRELRRYDVVSHASTVVVDITSHFGTNREIFQPHSSVDDRVHSFTVRTSTNSAAIGCGVYREDTQQMSFFGGSATLRECQVDKSGHWLLVNEGAGGDENRIIDLATGTSTVLSNANAGGGNVDTGFGLMIARDALAVPSPLRAWTFGPVTAGSAMYQDPEPTPPSMMFVSFQNARSAALDQQYACGSAVNRTNGPRANEIVCVKLDGSQSTLVVAPVMTDLDASGGGTGDAAKAPNGNLDPTGEYFLWTSNVMGGRLDAFLVRVPSQILVTPPADTTAPTVAMTAPAQHATVSGTVALSATATDFTGVAGVQFTLDGVNLGSELTSAPFTFNWNTTGTSDGVHALTAVARDADGNTAASTPISVTVLNAAAPAQISGVGASAVGQSSALISWTTNQLTDSQVEYGTNLGYGSGTTLDGSLTTSHLQLLSGLTGSTTYHFRVKSRNAQGVLSTSGDFTFTTPAVLAITSVATASVTGSTAVIAWTTNLAASSQVEFGLTTEYGEAAEFDGTLTTGHSQSIGPLAADTTYHYRVYSVAANGALAVSGDFTFRTPAAAGGSTAPGGFLETASSTTTRSLPLAATLQGLMPDRGAFTLPAPYATSAVRITAAIDCGNGDCVVAPGGAHWRNMSNSAGSNLMYIVVGLDRVRGGAGASVYRFNKTTQELVNLGPLFDPGDDLSYADAHGWYFSATAPTSYYVSIDRALRRYDVLTRAFTTVFDVTSQFGADKEVWQAHSSRNDLVHSFTLRYAGSTAPIGCGLYREATQQFSLYAAQGTFLDCQVDQTGQWLLMKEDQDGLGGADNRIIDLNTGAATTLLDVQGAGGSTDLGFGMMLAADDHAILPNAIRPWTFGPLTASPIVYHDLFGQPSTLTTISFANARSAPLAQQFACGSAVNRTNGPRANEVVCVRLDGSLQTLVVAPVMTDLDATGGGAGDAAKAPNGNLDPTGEYFLWASNVMGDRLDAFLVRVPSQILVTPPADITAPTVAITAPAAAGTVSGSTVALSATAADDNLAGVQFKLDGVNLGTELTSAPFAWVWNTTTTTDGVHVLTAVARDADGNTAVSEPVTVTVLNSPAAPLVTGVTTSLIGTTSAVVRWNTNQLANAQIEYGLTTAYGSLTTLDPALSATHLHAIAGLTAGTTYHFRVLSRNAQNVLGTSGDLTVTTSATLGISGVGPTNVPGTIAPIGWTTNLAASSQIEYGLTTAYGDATEFAPALTTAHTQTISGLAIGTTYHYRVYSVAGNGDVAMSGDMTFTTATYPVISGVGSSGLTATGATIGWTTDLASSTTVEYGPTTAYGSTANNASPVLSHTIGLGSLTPGTTYHYRVASTIADLTTTSADFSFTTVGPPVVSALTYVVANANVTWTTDQPATSKVEYGLTTAYGLETLLDSTLVTSHAQLVEGLTAGQMYHYRVISTNIYGLTTTTPDATFTAGIRPLISGITLVSVTGTTATYSWTTDQLSGSQIEYGLTTAYGTTTTLDPALVTAHTHTVTGLTPGATYHVRLLSPNADGLPGRSGDITLVMVPTVSDVTASAITGSSATIQWTSNHLTDSLVEYGLTTAYGSTSSDPAYVTSHSRVLTGLTGGTTYHFRVKSTNDAGLFATSADMTFTTVAPPVITNLTYVMSLARLTWTTDQASTSVAEWGLTTDYGLTMSNDFQTTAHSLELFGLLQGTTYHYRVSSTNSVGLTTTSADGTFTTGVKAIISDIAVTTITPTTATIEWTTDKQTSSMIEYGLTTDYGSAVINGSMLWLHSMTLTRLTESTTYHYRIVATDSDGVISLSPDQTFTTLGPPVITNVTYNVSTARVTWTTEQHATSMVEWGLTTAYGLSKSDSAFTLSHDVELFGLSPGLEYHYRVTSLGVSGLSTTTPDLTFTTGVRPVVSNVSVTNITTSSATVQWTTDQLANSRIEYGLTTAYGSSTTLDPALVTAHEQTLTGLQSNKTYHYRIISANADGLANVNVDRTFTTPNSFAPAPAPVPELELDAPANLSAADPSATPPFEVRDRMGR